MKPNLIPGMRTRGIKRASKTEHLKKQDRSFYKEQAAVKKAKLEEARRIKANKEYMI